MTTMRRLNERRQITIPAGLLRDAGLPEGGLYSIEARDGRIVLEPKEIGDKELADKDWAVLERFIGKQIESRQWTRYADPREAKKHFKRLRK